MYDRFGRLTLGGENKVRDVLEYVCYEKHLSDGYSRWRIHGKIIPEWMTPPHHVLRTHIKPKFVTEVDEEESDSEKKDSTEQAAMAS